ncbi:MAG: acetyl-CoA carboxylase carboxyltransferase subunit alpha [bacterium]
MSDDFDKDVHELEAKIGELKAMAQSKKVDMSAELTKLEAKAEELRRKAYGNMNAWQVVQLMRRPDRPRCLDYCERLFTDWLEIHGDHMMADDKSVITGFGRLDGRSVAVLGNQKGRDTKENLYRNFGMAQPEGFRKALRFMRMAEKFKLPILTFIDIMGAYPGIEGEERSVAEAIARNLAEMSLFKVPIIVSVIGEGGSGGALGLGVGDRILMLENGFYSVISPEGCASILWRDPKKAKAAAEALKGTARDLLKLKVIDEVVPEPLGGAQRDPAKAAANLKAAIKRHLAVLEVQDPETLVRNRYQKFRAMGQWQEGDAA